MWLSKIDFELISKTTGEFPIFLGNYIRTALSYHFFKAYCVNKREKICINCPYKKNCLYVALFESYLQNPSGSQLFLIHKKKLYVKTDDKFEFSITLYGDIWRLYTLFMGLMGKTLRIKDLHFIITKIIPYEVNMNELINSIENSNPKEAVISFDRVSVKHNNEIIQYLDDSTLIDIITRRYKVLSKLYGTLIESPVISETEIKTQKSYTLTRRKQGKYQYFPVLDAEILVKGNGLAPLIWLEYVGIGRSLTFGLGNVSIKFIGINY